MPVILYLLSATIIPIDLFREISGIMTNSSTSIKFFTSSSTLTSSLAFLTCILSMFLKEATKTFSPERFILYDLTLSRSLPFFISMGIMFAVSVSDDESEFHISIASSKESGPTAIRPISTSSSAIKSIALLNPRPDPEVTPKRIL